MTKRIIQIVIGLAISVTCLIIAFYNIDFKLFLEELKNINFLSVIFYTFFVILMVFFRSLLWKVTTGKMADIKIIDLFGGVIVGLLVNNFLPFRAGDLYRPYYLAKKTGLSKAKLFSTVIVERIFDVLFLGTFLLFGLLYGISGVQTSESNIFLIIVGVAFILGIFVLINLEKVIGFIEKLKFITEKVLKIIKNFLNPFLQIRKIKTIFLLILISFLIWTSIYFSLFSLVYDNVEQIIEATFLLMLFAYLVLLIPSSPGALGVVQLAFILALTPFGLNKEQAVSLSIIYQGTYYIITILIGLPFLLKAHISFKNVMKEYSKEKTN